jgi:hypothetical protein
MYLHESDIQNRLLFVKDINTPFALGCRYWSKELEIGINIPKFYCLVARGIEICLKTTLLSQFYPKLIGINKQKKRVWFS